MKNDRWFASSLALAGGLYLALGISISARAENNPPTTPDCLPTQNPVPPATAALSSAVDAVDEELNPKQFFSTGYLPRNDPMEGGHWGAYTVKDPNYPGYHTTTNSHSEKKAPVFSLYEYLNGDDVQSCPRFASCKPGARFKPTYVSAAVSKYIKLGSVLRIPDVEQYVRDHFFGAPAKGKKAEIPATPEQFVILPGEKYPTPFLRKHPQYLVNKENFEERVKAQIEKIKTTLDGPIPFVAHDIGGAINGAHVDICTGDRQFNTSASKYPISDKSLGVRKGGSPNNNFTYMEFITTKRKRELNVVPSLKVGDTTYSSQDYFEKVLLKAARDQVGGETDPLILAQEGAENVHHRKRYHVRHRH